MRLIIVSLFVFISHLTAAEKFLPAFPLETSEIGLHRVAQPHSPFHKAGRRFVILGTESGSFEAWAYPLKLLRHFEFSFLLGRSARPIPAADLVQFIDVTPSTTTLTYSWQSFTVKATYVTAIDDPFAMILLQVDSAEPLTILCSFLPVLQPMWPAGFGGQTAYWNEELNAYQISESTRSHTAYIGSPAAKGLSYTPAHMLSDTPSEFRIDIDDPTQAKNRYIPIYLYGGKGRRDSLKAEYKRLCSRPQDVFQQTAAHYQRLLSNTLQVITADQELNLAFAWAKISLDNLLVSNPDLGEGLVAGLNASGTSGRPGFGWFFGTDAFLNSLALNSCSALRITRSALAFVQKWQRVDGKIAHELSQSAAYIDWFGRYPYGYIHGDTTPFFIIALHDYFVSSADTAFIQQSWPATKKAFQWCLSMDVNQDGLIDNSRAGLGSVEYGALTELATDIYTGTLSVTAYQKMNALAQMMGDRSLQRKSETAWMRSKKIFDDKFWNAAAQTYANAFDEQGKQIQELSPWIALPAVFQVGDSAYRYASLQRLCRSDVSTDWGVRSLSEQSRYFDGLNYNYGAVWPFLTGYVSFGQFNMGLNRQAFSNLKNLAAHTFDNALGCIPELYSGRLHTWPAEAVAQQGFSSSAVALAMVRGWLGFCLDLPHRKLCFEPRVLPGYESLSLKHPALKLEQDFRRQDGYCSVSYVITSQTAVPLHLRLAPHLWARADGVEAKVNGLAAACIVNRHPQSVQPVIEVDFVDSLHVTFCFHEAAKLPLFFTPNRLAESNQGLKLIDVRLNDDAVFLTAEGLSGHSYEWLQSEIGAIVQVKGASVAKKDNKVCLMVDDAAPDRFVEFSLTVQ
ncbi:MAG TPA: GH116 family glycosyl hydrolase [bacterium]|nr:GH116 family glycosyl hydrolase [bacterium]